MNKYPVNLHWSDEDKAWIAVVPDLPGCCRAHGSTQQAALREAATATKLWLSVARKDGRDIPEPTGKEASGKLLVRMPKSLHRSLQLEALREGVSLNQLVVSLLSRKNR